MIERIEDFLRRHLSPDLAMDADVIHANARNLQLAINFDTHFLKNEQNLRDFLRVRGVGGEDNWSRASHSPTDMVKVAVIHWLHAIYTRFPRQSFKGGKDQMILNTLEEFDMETLWSKQTGIARTVGSISRTLSDNKPNKFIHSGPEGITVDTVKILLPPEDREDWSSKNFTL